MRRLKGTKGPSSSAVVKFGGGLEAFIPHDYTFSPTTNDRIAKLGSGAASRLISVASYDDELKAFEFNDWGTGRISTDARPEPDNYVWLDHGGLDKVWAHRDIVDHENHSSTLAERSDWVINQKKYQCTGLKKDQWWLVEIQDVGAPMPKGREFNGAGFLPSLYSKGGTRGGFTRKGLSGATFFHPERTSKGFEFKAVETGSRKRIRAVLSLNGALNTGGYTDGKRIAQFWHVFHMMPRPTPTETPKREFKDTPSVDARYRNAGGATRSPYGPAGASYNSNDPQNRARNPGGETVAGRENSPIGQHSGQVPPEIAFEQQPDESGGPDSDCMVEPWVGAIPSDVWLDVEGKATQLAFGDPEPALGDDPYYGWFWVSTIPGIRHPKYRPARDKSSDQPVLEHPDAPNHLRPVVPIPRHTGTPPPCEVQPHFDTVTPTYVTGGVLPPAHTGGSADAGEWIPPSTLVGKAFTVSDFRSGRLTYMQDSIPIPSTYTDMRFMVTVPYQIPTNLSGGEEIDLRLFYKVVSGAGAIAPDDWIELSKTLTVGDNPASADQVKHLTFEIPPIRLAHQGGGGRIFYWFMRRSDDSATGKPFRVVGNLQSTYYPARSHGRRTLGGAA